MSYTRTRNNYKNKTNTVDVLKNICYCAVGFGVMFVVGFIVTCLGIINI